MHRRASAAKECARLPAHAAMGGGAAWHGRRSPPSSPGLAEPGLFHAPCARRRRRPHGRPDSGRRVRRARRQELCGPARAEGPTSAPPLPCRLLLMALYNVSINLKGLRYISESPGFVPLLWWLLSGKEGSPHSSPAAPTPVLCGRRGW